jgi:protein-disulfide isomerase
MKKFYFLFGAVAAIGIGVVGFNVGSSMFGATVSEPIELDLSNDEELVALAQGMTSGPEDAPVTIVEFGDYQCPGCASFALSVKPEIERVLVGSGQVKLVYYDFPLISIGHTNAFLAARASRCAAEQDRYWDYHDALFRNQARWAGSQSPGRLFENYADDLDLDGGAFDACLNSDKYADVVTANMQLGRRMGVGGTPTVLINANGQTRLLNNYDFRSIQSAIETMTGASDSN